MPLFGLGSRSAAKKTSQSRNTSIKSNSSSSASSKSVSRSSSRVDDDSSDEADREVARHDNIDAIMAQLQLGLSREAAKEATTSESMVVMSPIPSDDDEIVYPPPYHQSPPLEIVDNTSNRESTSVWSSASEVTARHKPSVSVPKRNVPPPTTVAVGHRSATLPPLPPSASPSPALKPKPKFRVPADVFDAKCTTFAAPCHSGVSSGSSGGYKVTADRKRSDTSIFDVRREEMAAANAAAAPPTAKDDACLSPVKMALMSDARRPDRDSLLLCSTPRAKRRQKRDSELTPGDDSADSFDDGEQK